ncbi:MAG: putative lipid II flippase FtsW [Elusimicrobia bacterium]|nr:putative lipid II flippase FtsW [Elusimicrobiota bacterium]
MLSDRRRPRLDYAMLVLALALLCLGLIMVYSASAIWADQKLSDPFYFVKRQAVWGILGIWAMAFMSRFDYNRLKEWIWPIFAVTVAGLLLALASAPVGNVHRWIRLGPIGLQPSEFAKLAAAVFLAYYLDRRASKLDSPWRGFIIPMSFVGILLVLIGLEPDLGTPVLMFCVTLCVLFVAGSRLKHILAAAALAVPVVVYEILSKPYRVKRLVTFLTGGLDSQGQGYQVAQALLAAGSGGWLGKGFGASKLKLMYLPTPHTDFIFPVLCEELGLIGALTCLALFAGLLLRGLRAARLAPNMFGTLLATGLTLSICLQAFINMSMSIGLLPTKGITLPFISFGGSSLLGTLAAVGILLNISRQAQAVVPARARQD